MLTKKTKVTAKQFLCTVLVLSFLFTLTGFNTVNAGTESLNDNLTSVTGLKVVEAYSKVQKETGKIVTDYIRSPRELDDYHEMGTYKKAGVPFTVSELRLNDSDALKKYPKADSNFEAISQAISNQVYNGLKKSQAVFFTGADSDTVVGVAGGIRRAYPDKKLGLVYLDAHGNLHTADSSGETSVAAVMGIESSNSGAWNLASNNKAAFDALLLSDGRNLDNEEKKNLKKIESNAEYYDLLDTAALTDEDKWNAAVKALTASVDVIYLHIDADVLHQAYIPHTKAGDGEGPTIWNILKNIKAVMNTGKVSAVNLSSMYSETDDTGLTKNGFTIPEFPVETASERVNRFSMPSILSAVRMVSTTLENWIYMPKVPGSNKTVPKAEVHNGNLKEMKVVEIRTRNQTGGVLVARRTAAPMATDGKYTYEQRGEVIRENDHIFPNKIGYPRELDDWTLAGIYNQAGVPFEISQVVLSDKQADEKYPNYTRYEALCKEISDEVYDGVTDNKAVVVVGSGCMPVPAVAGGFRRAYGDNAKLGVIYIDAHGDINTVDSTYSGGIGGMDLAPTMGIDPHPTMQHWWNVCSDNGKPINELLHACGREYDSGVDEHDPDNPYEFGEMINLKKATSKDKYILNVNDFNNQKTFNSTLNDFVKQVDAIYLHIDMDALDGSFLPNGGSPVGYHRDPALIGPSVQTVAERIKTIMNSDKVAVVNLASTYGDPAYDKERLLRQGFVYPEIKGENLESEEARNRANSTAVLSGMRVLNAMTSEWKNLPKANYSEVKALSKKYAPDKSTYIKLNAKRLNNGKLKFTFSDKSVKKLKKFEDMGYTLSVKFYRAKGKSTNKYTYVLEKNITAKKFNILSSYGKNGTKYYYKLKISVLDRDKKIASVTSRPVGVVCKKK